MSFSRASRAVVLLAGLLSAHPTEAFTQSEGRILAAENFRREPNGVILARLVEGARLRVLAVESGWTQVELRGWVWLPSLQASGDAAFDLVVSVDGGENLRDGPGGEIVGRLEEGALLEELGREPSWAEVSRIGWVWSASMETSSDAPSRTPASPLPEARRPEGFATVGPEGGAILTAPDGDTLAVAAPESDVEVVRREGRWARVRLDGWMWMPPDERTRDAAGDEPSALEPADLTAEPDRYVGRVVSWTLQFISMERAEAIRSDFFDGEPFMLTRFGGADGPLVYVAVPPERLIELDGLVPLERVDVTARVRTGASNLTGTPIVDLLTLERSRRP